MSAAPGQAIKLDFTPPNYLKAWQKVLTVLSAALFITACTTNPYEPEVKDVGSQAPIEREGTTDTDDDVATAPKKQVGAATLALLASADEAQDDGEYTKAINYLERAVRLSPRDSDLWVRLASIYLQKDELLNATQHARKAIALASGDEVASAKAWLILADIKEAQGFPNEAKSIRREWRSRRG